MSLAFFFFSIFSPSFIWSSSKQITSGFPHVERYLAERARISMVSPTAGSAVADRSYGKAFPRVAGSGPIFFSTSRDHRLVLSDRDVMCDAFIAYYMLRV